MLVGLALVALSVADLIAERRHSGGAARPAAVRPYRLAAVGRRSSSSSKTPRSWQGGHGKGAGSVRATLSDGTLTDAQIQMIRKENAIRRAGRHGFNFEDSWRFNVAPIASIARSAANGAGQRPGREIDAWRLHLVDRRRG